MENDIQVRIYMKTYKKNIYMQINTRKDTDCATRKNIYSEKIRIQFFFLYIIH